ncbi:MAG: DUF3842 family protein [Chloroflexi bacterium]|nr:DUF3842 family protein [Chloroflexota bacterium]
MIKIRRWYIFLVSAISLHVVTWGIIALLRNLFILELDAPKSQIAFEIAVIIIGLPFYLGHWLWAQRLAARDDEERLSDVRSFYLYGMMVGFLAPFTFNVFNMARILMQRLLDLGGAEYYPSQLYFSGAIFYHFLALIVLALFWFYHYRLVSIEPAPPTNGRATARRLYIYGFSSIGLALTIVGISVLLNWILFLFGNNSRDNWALARSISQLVTGAPLWIIFWRQGQRLFYGPVAAEQESALRKFYLYLAVFVGAMTAVTIATVLFAEWLRDLLGLRTSGDIRDPLSIIVGAAILWIFHAYALREDAAAAASTDAVAEHPRQARIRRLYLYLVAGVGLAALLIGLGGEISVLIRSLAARTTISNDLREGLAWFTAALIAGLPVWLIPWQKAQAAATSDTTGVNERQSLGRRIYLYFYLFVAAMTMLSSAIYIVSQLIELMMGVRGTANLLSDLGHAIAFTLIAVGVWAYHWGILQGDGRSLQEAELQQLKALRVVILDSADNEPGQLIRDTLAGALPQTNLQQYSLSPREQTEEAEQPPLVDTLAQADVIIGPWTMVIEKEVGEEVATAVANSPARKLLIPIQDDDWDWVGVARKSVDKTVKETIHAVKQIAAGEKVEPKRPLGVGTIVASIIGGLILLSFLFSFLIYLIEEVL